VGNAIELDDEVDRLSFYIIRQLKVAVQDGKQCAKSVFEASVGAFFKRDYRLAEEVVSKVKEAMARR